MKKVVSILALVLLIGMFLPTTAFAAGPEDGRVVFGGDFSLGAGEILGGDLIVLGGNANLASGSTVQGSLLVLGGNTTLAGEVTGDISLLGGNLELASTSHVHGDISSMGGNVRRQAGAQVDGQVISGEGLNLPNRFNLGPSFIRPPLTNLAMNFSPVAEFLWFLFRTLMLAALAVLVVMFWPEPSYRVARAAVSQPFSAGGLGLLTQIIAIPALLLLLVTIILSPLSLIGALILIAAGIFGWIALGLEVGHRMAMAFNWDMHPAAEAGVGGLLMTFVAGGVGLIPCIGWVVTFVLVCTGLGAVLLTRFGSREYASMPVEALPEPAPAPKRSPRSTRRRPS
jgi:hypothetical protein